MQAVVLVRKLAAISRAPLIERTDLDSTALIEIGKGGFWGAGTLPGFPANTNACDQARRVKLFDHR